ncbi:MAG: holo-ACP synthase [Nitrospirae bacterium]|nr:holo-ACP synthase [Nitrospirota bacterium]MBI3595451.1 holo-ACP synthase [Nitrospirota bacterium]
MIIGIGIDIVQSRRIKEAIEKWEKRFLNRIFTPPEQEYCLRHKSPHLFFGGRFAVKEAMFKALGTGWRGGVQWKEIQVENLQSGQPVVQVFGKIKEILRQREVEKIHVSISHDTDYSLGEVILESR